MRRLFNAHVQLVYADQHRETSVSSSVADRTDLWWNDCKPGEPMLFNSKIELGEKFFQEIITHPVPIDMNTLTALKRCALGLDLYLWLTVVPHLRPPRSACGSPGVRCTVSLACTRTKPTISAPSSTSADRAEILYQVM